MTAVIPHVAVVGASGELGQALAKALAKQGGRLNLWGRDGGRLSSLATQCLDLGAAAVELTQIDLSETECAVAALRSVDRELALDMVIFAQGLGDTRQPDALFDDPMTVERLVQINFLTPAAMAAGLADSMARRGKGMIVFVGSAAAFHALPFAAAYASSKAGLARFAEALHVAMEPHGVSVRLVSPGFIDTAAAHRTAGPKPLMMSGDKAAESILAATRRSRFHSIIPWPFRLVRLLDRVLPAALRGYLLRRSSPPDL